jgi:hypothetical protein
MKFRIMTPVACKADLILFQFFVFIVLKPYNIDNLMITNVVLLIFMVECEM